VEFTVSSQLKIQEKADKSLVTACDRIIDEKLTSIVSSYGFSVISEEGKHVQKIVESGNYVTIDPIDGSLGYIDYANDFYLKNTSVVPFLKDLGPSSDFSLLLGIVENAVPKYGACYNYVTKEKIFLDGDNRANFSRTNARTIYDQENVAYVDQRKGDWIEDRIKETKNTTAITQATVGLKSLYTIINPHKSAIMCHRVQSSGLWEILPAAVASRIFGGEIYDDCGDTLKLNRYIELPGRGCTVIKGEAFAFVRDLIRNKQ
jgi:3'-phosphoadenosine 5'-phosphosulfate (PAPS) 3'-phosphatase